MSIRIKELCERIQASQSEKILDVKILLGELTVRAQPESIARLISFLRDDQRCRFRSLSRFAASSSSTATSAKSLLYGVLLLQKKTRCTGTIER